MKLLLLSDSHRDVASMAAAFCREMPDLVIHLGDHITDGQQLQQQFPACSMTLLPGNCDFSSETPTRLLTVEGQRLFLCHGHTLGVKSSLLRGAYAAREKNAQAFFFGHTHIPLLLQQEDLLLCNPGSIRDGNYAVVTALPGILQAELKRL